MNSTNTEKLTAQFYEWELLGRGWLFAEAPIELEPNFTPFFGHYASRIPMADDGLRHTVLSSIASAFQRKPQLRHEEVLDVSYDLYPFTDTSSLITFTLFLSKQSKISAIETEQLLTMLSYCTRPVSFEIIGRREDIKLQFVCREEDSQYIKAQLSTFLKGIAVVLSETNEYEIILENRPYAVIDFGLKEEFMRPLSQFKGSAVDPFIGMFSILEHLKDDEQVVFQVLFNGTVNHWQSSIMRSVADAKGGSFFENAPEMLPLAKEKVGSSLFSATIRFLVQAKTLTESFSLIDKLSFALVTNTSSSVNSLLPLANTDYSVDSRLSDIIGRESHRAGMLLNAKELASFVHIPDLALIGKKLLRQTRKTKAAPTITEGKPLLLGKNYDNGIEKEVGVSNEQRLTHTYIIGATGTGKSTLLMSMICQDIEHGEGIAVLDPHGDLIESILSCIPGSRINDVLIIDPADSEYPVGFNILKAHSEIEKQVLSSDLVSIFRRQSTSWGDQMNSVFANAILAFLESTKGGTLIDLRRFLIERPYREAFLQTVSDPSIRYYWQKEYPLLKTNSVGPILTRLDAFLRPRLIRNMVAQPKGLDFEDIIDNKKIVLIKLSQGLIGEENSYLLGSLIVSKIHQAAFARQSQERRSDFFVYIDEFQHFITPSMGHILSGARKYHVGLILAHQDLLQLQRNDSDLLNNLLANTGTRICFRIGDTDAKRLADGFSSFDAADFQNLGKGEAIVRIEKPEFDLSMTTIPFEKENHSFLPKETVHSHSRNVYGTPREAVEKIVAEAMGIKSVNENPIQEYKHEPVEMHGKPTIPEPEANISSKEKFEQTQEVDISQVIEKKQQSQHRYLQSLIKKVAESKGFKATIEMSTPDRKGSVDVLLEGYSQTIACEVSITTDMNWEIHNIQKCLTAGYNYVYVCCTEPKQVNAIKMLISEAPHLKQNEMVMIGLPDELFSFLDEFMKNIQPTEEVVKGYRVKVEYDQLSTEDMQKKRNTVARIISEAMKKLKK